MKIEVLCSINSGQYNVGDVIDLPKDQAKRLVKIGAAKKVSARLLKKPGNKKSYTK